MLNKNINFNKAKRNQKWKISHTVLERPRELKNVMSWSSRKKKKGIFCIVYFVRMKFFKDLRFISMYSVLNTHSEYTYFYISKKHFFKHFCCLFLIDESLQCILNSHFEKEELYFSLIFSFHYCLVKEDWSLKVA